MKVGCMVPPYPKHRCPTIPPTMIQWSLGEGVLVIATEKREVWGPLLCVVNHLHFVRDYIFVIWPFRIRGSWGCYEYLQSPLNYWDAPPSSIIDSEMFWANSSGTPAKTTHRWWLRMGEVGQHDLIIRSWWIVAIFYYMWVAYPSDIHFFFSKGWLGHHRWVTWKGFVKIAWAALVLEDMGLTRLEGLACENAQFEDVLPIGTEKKIRPANVGFGG